MRMTLHTDYALRMLMYAAMRRDGLCTVNDVAKAYGLSLNHLRKVAQTLRKLGFIETTRGRAGGIRMAMIPDHINIGALVRVTEEDFSLVECMHAQGGGCVIAPVCKLKGLLSEALAAYLAVLDNYTLADIIRNKSALDSLLNADESAA